MFKLEVSPSNRAKCCKCKELIKKGELRIKESDYDGRYMVSKYYCALCSITYLKERKVKIKTMLKDLINNNKKKQGDEYKI